MYYFFFLLLSFYLHSSTPVISESSVRSKAVKPVLRTSSNGTSVALWFAKDGLSYSTAQSQGLFSRSNTLHQGTVNSYNCSFNNENKLLTVFSVGRILYFYYGNPSSPSQYTQKKQSLTLPCERVYASRIKFCTASNKFYLFLNTDEGILFTHFDSKFSDPVVIYKNTDNTLADSKKPLIEWLNFTIHPAGDILVNWIELKKRSNKSSVPTAFTLKWTEIKNGRRSNIGSKEFKTDNQGYITQPAVFYNNSSSHPWTITYTQNYYPTDAIPSTPRPQIHGFLLTSSLEATQPKSLSNNIDGTAGNYLITQRKPNELIVIYKKQTARGNYPFAVLCESQDLLPPGPIPLQEIQISEQPLDSTLNRASVSIDQGKLVCIFSNKNLVHYSVLPHDSTTFINFAPHNQQSNITGLTINTIPTSTYSIRYVCIDDSSKIRTNYGSHSIYSLHNPVSTQR